MADGQQDFGWFIISGIKEVKMTDDLEDESDIEYDEDEDLEDKDDDSEVLEDSEEDSSD